MGALLVHDSGRPARWRVLESEHAASARARTNHDCQGRFEGLDDLVGDLDLKLECG